MWESDAMYAPGIQIIEATPKSSPCPSERYSHEQHKRKIDRLKMRRYDDNSIDSITEYPDEANNNNDEHIVNLNANSNKQQVVDNLDNFSTQLIRRAPLASLSSFKLSSVDYQDSDLKSCGSDSVFADTDEDMEQFSTDSDEISLTQSPPPPPMNSQHEQQLNFEDNNNDTRFNINHFNKNNCDASGASVSVVVDIDNDMLSRNYKDDSSLLSSNITNSQLQQPSPSLQQPQQKFKSNSVNLINAFETKVIIERHHKNDKITRPASYSGCLSSFNNLIKNESSNNNNNEHSTSATVSRATAKQEKDLQTGQCIEIKVIDSPTSLSPTVQPPPTNSSSVVLELPNLTSQSESSATTPLDPSVSGTSRKWSKETLF